MKVNEILNEDDYYPRERDDRRTEDELNAFLDGYVVNQLGEPHKANAQRDMGIIVNIPRNKNRKEGQRWDYEGQREDWLAVSEDLIEELDQQGFGRYELVAINASYIELDLKHATVNETCSGGIATVVSGGSAPAFTRGASVYGKHKPGPRKKKKAGPYANSKQDK